MSARAIALLLAALGCLAAVTPAVAGQPQWFAPEVYRGTRLMVRAGIAAPDGQIVHFGDVLSLVVMVSWDRGALTLEEPGERFFADAWVGSSAPVVVEQSRVHVPGADGYTDELRYVWRFQLLGCPGDKPTCPGDRVYPMPEFTLRYVAGAGPGELMFRPRPQELTVITAIERDEAGELRPFAAYFPSGAYPDPLPVRDRTRTSLAVLGIGSLILIGGTLMWPLRLRRKQLFASAERPRWEKLLLELETEESGDEKQLADRMRRCLVWYCSDSLGADPFEWLDSDRAHDAAHAELRALFLDLLHDPTGRCAELRNRLTAVVTARA